MLRITLFRTENRRTIPVNRMASSTGDAIRLLTLLLLGFVLGGNSGAAPVVTDTGNLLTVRDKFGSPITSSSPPGEIVSEWTDQLSYRTPSDSPCFGNRPGRTNSGNAFAQNSSIVSPTEFIFSGRISAANNPGDEDCNSRSIESSAGSGVRITTPVDDPVQYLVLVSGYLGEDEGTGGGTARLGLDGVLDLDQDDSPDPSRSIDGWGNFSITYKLRQRPNAVITSFLDAGVNANTGFRGFERDIAGRSEVEYSVRIKIMDPNEPPEPEICDSGFDEDGDGLIDAADTECPSPEVCDNGLDDDFDGDIDLADIDCAPPEQRVNLTVRCTHEPVYPQDGETVTIKGFRVGEDSFTVNADTVEIFVNDSTTLSSL